MPSRTYQQVARAEATGERRGRIVAAAQALFEEEDLAELPLERVAGRAGVTPRTILRHFGTKDGLIEAAVADAEAKVRASREAPPGDAELAIRRLFDHYEELGDGVVRRLGVAATHPLVRQVTEAGERLHVEWVESVFAPDLDALRGEARRRRLAVLASLTDVYMWHLLRRRRNLSRKASEDAVRELVHHARAMKGSER